MDEESLRHLIELARLEDLGVECRDVTSERFVSEGREGAALIQTRERGVACGLAVLPVVARVYDPGIVVNARVGDGDPVEPGVAIADVSGALRSLLAFERVALNFLMHLSGVATATAGYVCAAGGRCAVCDTRKTLPGLRGLQKYAVACGGGRPHRRGLYDAVLVKDNHLGSLSRVQVEQALIGLLDESGREGVVRPDFVEVEVDHLEQLRWVLRLMAGGLPGGVPRVVLLDNMPVQTLREAVSMRDELAPMVLLEASGGVTLDTVAQVAQAGVDRIAVGALTHSARALDIGMDLA